VVGDAEEMPVDYYYLVSFHNYDGFTNCGLFSSGDGSIESALPVTPPSNSPYQAEVDVDWTAGSNCSGIAYALSVTIMGPDGIPFE
jgi:hypothetical protein